MTDTEIILESYKKYNKITKVMKDTGYTYPKIKRILLENGLFEQKGLGYKKRKYTLDDDFFNNIDSQEKAYWLGFIWGDGYITHDLKRVGISLCVSDKTHLEKFKELINYTGDIKIYDIKGGYKTINQDGTPTQYCRLLITSPKMVNDLIDKGLQLNKSLVMTPPKENMIPNNLKKDFLRGLIDANGSICKSNKTKVGGWRYHILGTLDIINYFKSFYSDEKYPKLYQRKPDCPIYDMDYRINKNNIYLLDMLYESSKENCRLDRKYFNYKAIKEYLK